jgi:hypothetical protein
MVDIDLFSELVKAYMGLHPNAQNPEQYVYVIDINIIIEMLQNANGREIIFTYGDTNIWDGCNIAYKEN